MKKMLCACVLLLCPMIAWAQTSETAVFDKEGNIETTIHALAGPGDAGFDKMVDWELAAGAASAFNPVGLADVAIQLAEAEKIMLRPHSSISVSALFQLAIRAAVKQGDGETLERLAKGAKVYGMDEIAKDAETSKALAGASRSGAGSDNKFAELLEQLSDEEKFQLSVSQNRIAASSNDLEELQKTRAALAEDTNLTQAAKDYLLAEIDAQAEELGTFSEGEREVLLALSGASRQAQGGLIAYSGVIRTSRGDAYAVGEYWIYENGQIKVHHWTKIGARSGTAYSTFLLVVVERVNGQNRIIWATKHDGIRGSNPLHPSREQDVTEWRSMPRAVADKIRNGRATIQFTMPCTTSSSGDAKRTAFQNLSNMIGQQAAQEIGSYVLR